MERVSGASELMCAASKGKLSLGLFLFFCSFQVSPINVTVTELLLSSTSLEENKETICVSVTRKIPPIMVLITFLFTSVLLAVAIKLKYIKCRQICSSALGCRFGDCFQHLKPWAGATHDGCCSSPRAEPPQPGSRDAAGPQCTPGLINDIWFRGICVGLKAQVKQDKLYQYVIRRRVE